jgi:hypothetical protein
MLFRRKKKGQAAMEFLMTYGWALLVVLVVIGALYQFDVFNLQKVLPKKCVFAAGMNCADHTVYSNGGVLMAITNGIGSDIQVTELHFKSSNNIIGCSYRTDKGVNVPRGKTVNFAMLQDYDENALCNKDTMEAFEGQRIDGDIELVYKDLQTGFPHRQPGTLKTDVEPGAIPSSFEANGMEAAAAAGDALPEDDAGFGDDAGFDDLPGELPEDVFEE